MRKLTKRCLSNIEPVLVIVLCLLNVSAKAQTSDFSGAGEFLKGDSFYRGARISLSGSAEIQSNKARADILLLTVKGGEISAGQKEALMRKLRDEGNRAGGVLSSRMQFVSAFSNQNLAWSISARHVSATGINAGAGAIDLILNGNAKHQGRTLPVGNTQALKYVNTQISGGVELLNKSKLSHHGVSLGLGNISSFGHINIGKGSTFYTAPYGDSLSFAGNAEVVSIANKQFMKGISIGLSYSFEHIFMNGGRMALRAEDVGIAIINYITGYYLKQGNYAWQGVAFDPLNPILDAKLISQNEIERSGVQDKSGSSSVEALPFCVSATYRTTSTKSWQYLAKAEYFYFPGYLPQVIAGVRKKIPAISNSYIGANVGAGGFGLFQMGLEGGTTFLADRLDLYASISQLQAIIPGVPGGLGASLHLAYRLH